MTIKKTASKKQKEFWKAASEARKEVSTWPEWKQNYRITKFSPGVKAHH